MKATRTLALAATLMTGAAGSQAALVDRGGGMIYDTTLNITWLADMNYAKTSGFDANGKLTWDTAVKWADDLVYGGFSDWRLPTLNPYDTTCSNDINPGGGFPIEYLGGGCTGGELSHLFVTDLGNKENESVLDTTGDTVEQIANQALFTNLEGFVYWSGTERISDLFSAWIFIAGSGEQTFFGKSAPVFYAPAVRPGDVLAVPEPQPLALLLAAITALAWVRRRPASAASRRA